MEKRSKGCACKPKTYFFVSLRINLLTIAPIVSIYRQDREDRTSRRNLSILFDPERKLSAFGAEGGKWTASIVPTPPTPRIWPRSFEKDNRGAQDRKDRRRLFVKTRLRMYPWLAIDHGPTPRRQIKRMSAGKTISLYLESRERSLPVRGGEELFEPARSLLSSRLRQVPFIPRRPNGS